MAKNNDANIRSGDDSRGTNDEPVEIKQEKKIGRDAVKKYTATKREVTIVFRENRKFDLHVGRDTVVFGPGEAKSIPREWLKHPDFRQVQRYFAIRGV